MQKIVLIGANIAHSRSPYLHNTLFRRYDLPYHYELMPVAAADVLATLQHMKRGGYRGANVTSPHKQIVMEGLDDLSDEARAIGAANTIVFESGRAVGHNTDVEGFRGSLQGKMWFDAPFTAAMLGTGGAALAAIHTLLEMKDLRAITLYSRNAVRAADAILRWNDKRLHSATLDDFHPADLVVHATPVGLAGDPRALLAADQLRGSRLLYEMIYSPAETALMRAALAAGISVLGGGAMFIGQALRSFKLWTGVDADPGDVPEDLFERVGA